MAGLGRNLVEWTVVGSFLCLQAGCMPACCGGATGGGGGAGRWPAERYIQELERYLDAWSRGTLSDAESIRTLLALNDQVRGRGDLVRPLVEYAKSDRCPPPVRAEIIGQTMKLIRTPEALDALLELWEDPLRYEVKLRNHAFYVWEELAFDPRNGFAAPSRDFLEAMIAVYENRDPGDWMLPDYNIYLDLLRGLIKDGRESFTNEQSAVFLVRCRPVSERILRLDGSGWWYRALRGDALGMILLGATPEERARMLEGMEVQTAFRDGDQFQFRDLVDGVYNDMRFGLTPEQRSSLHTEFDERIERFTQRYDAWMKENPPPSPRHPVRGEPGYVEVEEEMGNGHPEEVPGPSPPPFRVAAVSEARAMVAQGLIQADEARRHISQSHRLLSQASGENSSVTPELLLATAEYWSLSAFRFGSRKDTQHALWAIEGLEEYRDVQIRALELHALVPGWRRDVLESVVSIQEKAERSIGEETEWKFDLLRARLQADYGSAEERRAAGEIIGRSPFEVGDPRSVGQLRTLSVWLAGPGRAQTAEERRLQAEAVLNIPDELRECGRMVAEDVLEGAERMMSLLDGDEEILEGLHLSLAEDEDECADAFGLWDHRPDVLTRWAELLARCGDSAEAAALYRMVADRYREQGERESVRAADHARERLRLDDEARARSAGIEEMFRRVATGQQALEPVRVPGEELERAGGAEAFCAGCVTKAAEEMSRRVCGDRTYLFGESGLAQIGPEGVLDYCGALEALNDSVGFLGGKPRRVTAVAQAGEEIWIGRTYGVVVYDREKIEWRTLPLGGLDVDQAVLSIEALGPTGRIVRITAGPLDAPRVYDYDREYGAWLP